MRRSRFVRRAAWRRFHDLNPRVYDEFKRLAFSMKRTGRKRYSARAIFTVLRWESDLRTTGSSYKLNNNHSPFYARLLIREHPEFEGFFELRGRKKRAS